MVVSDHQHRVIPKVINWIPAMKNNKDEIKDTLLRNGYITKKFCSGLEFTGATTADRMMDIEDVINGANSKPVNRLVVLADSLNITLKTLSINGSKRLSATFK